MVERQAMKYWVLITKQQVTKSTACRGQWGKAREGQCRTRHPISTRRSQPLHPPCGLRPGDTQAQWCQASIFLREARPWDFWGVCVCMKSPHSNGWDAINSLWAARLGLTVPQGWRRR